MADANDDKNKGGADDQGNKDDKQNQAPDNQNQDDKGGDDSQNQDKKLPDTVPYSELAKARAERKEALDKLKAAEDAQKAADEAKMKENNQFKELAETKDKELSETKAKYETSLKKVRFAELAMKEGVVNVDDAFRLADFDGVTVSDDGSVSGMEDVIAKVKEGKPYLFGSQDQTLGGGSNPPKDGDTQAGKRIYKQSQIEDPEFYAANKPDILKAYQEGRVVSE